MRFALIVALVLAIASLGSTNIQSDLKDFYNLLPTFRLSVIAAKHYFFDGSFRTGLNFLKSNEFKQLLRQDFANSPEVQEIVNYLNSPVSLNFIENSFRSVNVDEKTAENSIRPRSFVSFVDEVIGILPINKIKQMIARKVNSSEEFSNFYRRISDPEFERLVYKARNSESLRSAIRKLESKEVKVDHILRSVLEVLNKISN